MDQQQQEDFSGEVTDQGDFKSLNDRVVGRPDGSAADKEFFIRHAFDKDAVTGYELLFRRYYRVMCSHAARYVYSKETAEDLVAEVFYTFWKKESHQRITTSFRAYLFTAVRHKCFNYLKWEFRKEDADELDELENNEMISPVPQPDQMMEFDELNIRIDRAIGSLPPQCQKVFLMSRFEGKNYHEIAENLGVSTKAVEAHISKALSIFRRALTRE